MKLTCLSTGEFINTLELNFFSYKKKIHLDGQIWLAKSSSEPVNLEETPGFH